MSLIVRAGARLNGVGKLRRLPAVTQVSHKNEYLHAPSTSLPFLTTCAAIQTVILRNISWMAFELPDPALYQSPLSLQPKRPAAAEAIPNADGVSPAAQPIAMAGRVGTVPSAVAASSRASATGKVIPASVPASAMRSGPVPLSQIQKRTIAGSDSSDREPATLQSPTPPPNGQDTPTDEHFPTLQVRMPGHPATWRVDEPRDDERQHNTI
ncbi:hypothetical protein F4803DRAFT_505514 [Xylaria telfairii]|nr:hypothetical protein F4803DRAFT_505514 [Xylaria telfairii]